MVFVSNKYSALPLYVYILFSIFYKRNYKVGILMTLSVLLTFGLCDFLSVHLFKDVFERLRPGYDPSVDHLIRMLENKGGLYGFISSHAANVFGLATISSLLLRKKWFAWFMFIWAFLVGYSRIYVGKHFPLDVICGAAFGILIGYLVFLLYKKSYKHLINKKNVICC